MDPTSDRHRAIVLKVNGEEHPVAVKDGETLLDVLRDKLRLTGTKKGCDQGVCGACTVLIDGEPKNSCLLLAAACRGAEITTIEGDTPADLAGLREGDIILALGERAPPRWDSRAGRTVSRPSSR